MDSITLWLIPLGLSMDAFAVTVSNGAVTKRIRMRHVLTMALTFGAFQAGMLLLGSLLGKVVSPQLTALAYWIAFFVLGAIGLNMILAALKNRETKTNADGLRMSALLMLALATSIDAFAVGVTLSFIRADVILAAGVVGGVTFALSICGAFVGKYLGSLIGKRAELVGGVILIGIGIKILVQNVLIR
ncbi:MAG: manganese efflux pump MntP family protein [Bacillota bacterium]